MNKKLPFSVFATSNHPGNALARLAARVQFSGNVTFEGLSAIELLKGLRHMDGAVLILQNRIDEQVLQQCPNLKVVANVAVGYDNIDVDSATRHGILVLNTPGVLDNSTADIAFALMISAARRLAEGDRFVRAGRWRDWRPDLLMGTDLSGKTLGIVGLGRIGQVMAKRARAFDMKIVYSQRNRNIAAESAYGAHWLELDELLKTADFISLHCPLSEETRHLLGEREFRLMKENCIVINTSRGAVVDERALVNALACGRIAGAGLDVFEFEPKVSAELISMENVVLTPHIGSSTIETRSAMVGLAVDGLLSAFEGKLPTNCVNSSVWDRFLERIEKSIEVVER